MRAARRCRACRSDWRLTAALLAVWLVVDPRTPDLAAQVYRLSLFRELGFTVWDEHWYAGHSLPGYSLLYPPLGVAAGHAAAGGAVRAGVDVLFAALVGSAYGPRARWGAAWFAVAALGDVWIGRLTFALGVPLALAAGLALVRGRWLWAAVLAALCAAASPVAGVLLGLAAPVGGARAALAAALLVLAGRRRWWCWRSRRCSPKAAMSRTRSCRSRRRCGGARVPVGAAAPARLLRIGAGVYLLACVACLAVRSPMGSNVERYAVLLAGPLLLCARSLPAARRVGVVAARGRRAAGRAGSALRLTPAGVLALVCDRGVGGVGTGARDTGGRGQRSDERLLLRRRWSAFWSARGGRPSRCASRCR